jgi:AGCS family alanine or glycine:cation symporter
MNVASVINITDAMMIAMCVPNIIVLYILAPEVKRELKKYCQKYKIARWANRAWLAEVEPVVENQK